MNGKQRTLSRRDMMKTSAMAAAPLILPFGLLGAAAPSNTLRMACIGTGRMGHGDMNECISQGLGANARVVAVCDLDSRRAQHAKGEVEKRYTKEFGEGKFEDVKVYGDYRELLERDDIDGVTISTPEHWHALIAIAAANAGKDSYVQKPLTYSVVEGQRLVEAVRKNKVILQTGSQQRSSVYFRRTCEFVRNGRIGKLHTIEVSLPTDHGVGENIPMEVPEELNYDMWMGPTEPQPYTEHRVHPNRGYGRPGWLQIERYCRGMITGWGAHMYDIAQWGLGTDMDSGPVEMEATAEFPDRGLFDVHTNFESTRPLRQRRQDAGPYRRSGRCQIHRRRRLDLRGTRCLQVRSREHLAFEVDRRRDPPLRKQEPHAQFPRVHAQPQRSRRSRRGGPPLQQRLRHHAHRHEAEPQAEMGSGERALRERRRGQRHARLSPP